MQFSIWKYLLLLFLLTTGILYALPNIYPSNPAVQVSYISSSQSPDDVLVKRVRSSLSKISDKLSESIEVREKFILVRVASSEEQLEVRSLLFSDLGDDSIVALNLAPTTPDWLVKLNANPMKLGLDLRGGVHFLMEVDTKTALTNRQNGILQDIKRVLKGKKIRYQSAYVDQNQSIIINLKSKDNFSSALEIIEKDYLQFKPVDIEDADALSLTLVLSEVALEEIISDAISQNLTTLRNRVNELGVSEPIVQKQGKNRIVVQLPGIQDTVEAKKILGKTATLEFRLEANYDTPRSRKTTFNFKESSGGGTADLENQIILSGNQVASAQSGFDENGFPQVNISLDGQGGARMHRATRNEIGRRLGVLFVEQKTRTKYVEDDSGEIIPVQESYEIKEIISLATIRAALPSNFRITGVGNSGEASELALLLRAGALAAPMRFVEERTVGPSLGAENIKAGVMSMQLGLMMVLLFILFYYRVFGIAASLALIANIILLVAAMSIIGATLTLPGIAGIVLTVGMAVDANVLIFSRIREELKLGKEPFDAIVAGYDRAFVTIWDANVTTLLVAIILHSLGTGPIKGFAITLSIGIVTSMITSILGTRAFITLVYGNRINLNRISIG